VTFARSPIIKKKEYTDSATQYSPSGFPPTYRETTASTSLSEATEQTPCDTPQTGEKRRETSAESAITDPPEPKLRLDPQPVATGHDDQRSDVSAENKKVTDVRQSKEKHEGADNGDEEQPSSSKRARPQDPEVKIMPLKYETCDVKDLGVLMADMLMELVRLNDGIPLRDAQLTRFHSRAPPAISVRDYLFRLIVHATLSPPILLSMVYYVDSLCALYPAFTINSLTVHRFLITAATVAAKGLSDSFWTNSLYARVGGVSLKELALLELEFLRRLEWKIVPKPEILVDYYKWLVERGAGYEMEKDETEKDPERAESSISSLRLSQTTEPAQTAGAATSATGSGFARRDQPVETDVPMAI
jgi:hypothetical protein